MFSQLFKKTRQNFRSLHLFLLIVSQSFLVFIPLLKIFTQSGSLVKNIILASISFALLIVNLCIETHDRKRAKKEKKIVKKVRKISKLVANVANLFVLAYAWYINEDPSLLVPLIFASLLVAASLTSTAFSVFKKTLVDGLKEDAADIGVKVKSFLKRKPDHKQKKQLPEGKKATKVARMKKN